MRTINHWINGQTVATSAERTGAVYDPATGQQAAQVAYATGDDVDANRQGCRLPANLVIVDL